MMAGKKKKKERKKTETHPLCNRTSPVYNFNQQDYANFRHKLKLSETAWTCILGCRVNQTDFSNTNNIFTPITPVNSQDKHPEQDFNEAIENECI